MSCDAGGPVPKSHQKGPYRSLSTPLPPQPTALTLKQACSHPLLGSETLRANAAEDTATSPAAKSKQPDPFDGEWLWQQLQPSVAAGGRPSAPLHSVNTAVVGCAVPQQVGFTETMLPPGTAEPQSGNLNSSCHIKEEPLAKLEVSLMDDNIASTFQNCDARA